MKPLRYYWAEGIKPMFSPMHLGIVIVIALAALFDTRCRNPAPSTTGIDSTAYYKNLYQQERLNAELQEQLQLHEEEIKDLYRLQEVTLERIDDLSGDDLQGEIDRQFNQPGHAPKRGTPIRDLHRGRSAAGPPVQEPLRDSRSGDRSERPPIIVAGFSPEQNGFDCLDIEPRWAGFPKPSDPVPTGFSAEPDKVARSQTGQHRFVVSSAALRSRSRRVILTLRQKQFLRAIRQSGYCFPDVAAAISAIETGWWYGEDRMMRLNNLFGFKQNRRAYYTGLTQDRYCFYKEVGNSLADYGAYEQHVIKKYGLRSERAYLAHICQRFNPNAAFRTKLYAALRVIREEAV